MKIAVIYASKTGFTQKYAEWLRDALNADCFALNRVSEEILKNYDLVVFGGGLYAGGINGLKHFRRLVQGLETPKIIYFATGATPDREEVVPELLSVNFSPAEQKTVKLFYLRGGFDFGALTVVDQFLMMLLKFKIKIKAEEKRTADERGMLAVYGRPVDFTKATYIDPVVTFIKASEGV